MKTKKQRMASNKKVWEIGKKIWFYTFIFWFIESLIFTLWAGDYSIFREPYNQVELFCDRIVTVGFFVFFMIFIRTSVNLMDLAFEKKVK